jgi:hypothetical protein
LKRRENILNMSCNKMLEPKDFSVPEVWQKTQ